MWGVIKIVEVYKDIQITNDFLGDILKNNDYNKKIVEYYNMLVAEEEQIDYDSFSKEKKDNLQASSKVKAILDCNKLWQLDKYQKQGIKDFKRTNLCKDKFCSNCKKVKQASRMTQFIPVLQKLEEEFDLFHVTLTVPNVEGHDYLELIKVIKKMFDSYRKLNHYLLNIKKIKDIDFQKYLYIGSIRSLEVTYKNDSYHPHLHCIFAMKKGLKLTKKFKNVFSNSKKNGKRKFSELEILIQKIWKLTNEGVKVTKKNIDDLEVGYSCSIDKVEEEHYFEVFKYMTKSNSDDNEEFMSYDNFKVLYYSLKSVRQIQGYGILYNLKEDLNLEQEVDYFYNNLINELQKKENPLEVFETPEEVLNNNDYIVISRKKIFSYLRTL